MKKLFSIFVLLWSLVLSSGQSNSISLGWCPSPSPEASGYYIVYAIKNQKVAGWTPNVTYRPETNPCNSVLLSSGTNWILTYSTNRIDVGNTNQTTVTNLIFGATYYFNVIAYSPFGDESPLANEIEYTVPLPPPITYIGTRLEWWTNMAYMNRQVIYLTSFTNPPPQFYRSFLVMTNRFGSPNVFDLKTRLEWYTNMAFINRQTFDLKSFTNASYFFRSFLIITNRPF